MPRPLGIVLAALIVSACGGGGGGGGAAAPAPVQQPPPAQPPPVVLPVLGPDVTGPLSAVQTANLALLAKVWGFVKYHHPAVTTGGIDWDSELILALPDLLDAGDAEAGQDAILAWLDDAVGEPADCGSACAAGPVDIYFPADNAWIADDAYLGSELSGYLQRVHTNRSATATQAYVSLGVGVNNAVFASESAYPAQSLPDGGFRLLALFRVWNIVQYFFPYRDLLDEPWDQVLGDSIADYYEAETRGEYARALVRTFARIDDTHANLWDGRWDVVPPRGACQLPVAVRFAEDSAVVYAFLDSQLGPDSGLERGDVLVNIGGRSISSLVAKWTPYYPASNEPARMRDIARVMTRGDCGPVDIDILRAGAPLSLTTDRVSFGSIDTEFEFTDDLAGETFQLIAPDIAYLKLSSVLIADSATYINDADGTDGLIIDIRNYPNEFVVFSLGQHLVSSPSQFATFTIPDLRNPGAFVWGAATPTLQPTQPFYDGRVAILINEKSQSQSEYTAMAFRTAPDSAVFGSTTAGADGNLSNIPIPGGMRGAISGIGVFYPDRTPTQQIGIIADFEIEPTIAGLAAGEDEVLQAAIDWIRLP